MKNILIVGTGGLAREFTAWFSRQARIVGYSSTNHDEHADFKLPGKLYKGEVTPDSVGTDLVVVAIGAPSVKAQYHERLSGLGFRFPTFIHPSSIVSEHAVFGQGVVVSPHCVVGPNVTLDDLCYLNFGCGIGHDSRIGRFVQINPGCQLGGFSRIGERTLIGSGSTIRDRSSVGAGATVGSGSAVLASVADGATVLGNPARHMRHFESNSQDTG